MNAKSEFKLAEEELDRGAAKPKQEMTIEEVLECLRDHVHWLRYEWTQYDSKARRIANAIEQLCLPSPGFDWNELIRLVRERPKGDDILKLPMGTMYNQTYKSRVK